MENTEPLQRDDEKGWIENKNPLVTNGETMIWQTYDQT